jgi:hypothetical protein
MKSNAIKDGWQRFLEKLKQLWGRPSGAEVPRTELVPTAPVSQR